MPSRTNEDKIDELTKMVSGHVEQLRAIEGRLDVIVAERADLAREVVAFGKSLAVFEQQLKDIRGWKESFGTIDQPKVELALMRKRDLGAEDVAGRGREAEGRMGQADLGDGWTDPWGDGRLGAGYFSRPK